MNKHIEWVRAHWWVPIIPTALFSLAIMLLAPKYTDVQVAGTADVFRAAVADVGKGRTTLAAVADILFVASYFWLAIGLVRMNIVSRVGFALLTAAALADMTENALVISAIQKGADLKDSGTDLIRSVGVIKWSTVIAGALIMIAGLAISRSTR